MKKSNIWEKSGQKAYTVYWLQEAYGRDVWVVCEEGDVVLVEVRDGDMDGVDVAAILAGFGCGRWVYTMGRRVMAKSGEDALKRVMGLLEGWKWLAPGEYVAGVTVGTALTARKAGGFE